MPKAQPGARAMQKGMRSFLQVLSVVMHWDAAHPLRTPNLCACSEKPTCNIAGLKNGAALEVEDMRRRVDKRRQNSQNATRVVRAESQRAPAQTPSPKP